MTVLMYLVLVEYICDAAAVVDYCCVCWLLLQLQESTGTCFCQCIRRYRAVSI